MDVSHRFMARKVALVLGIRLTLIARCLNISIDTAGTGRIGNCVSFGFLSFKVQIFFLILARFLVRKQMRNTIVTLILEEEF